MLLVWDQHYGAQGEDSEAPMSPLPLGKGGRLEQQNLKSSGGLLPFPLIGQLRFYNVHLFSYTTVMKKKKRIKEGLLF